MGGAADDNVEAALERAEALRDALPRFPAHDYGIHGSRASLARRVGV